MKKEFSMAIVGAGAVANMHAAAIVSVGARLTAVVDPIAEKADVLASRYGARVVPTLDELFAGELPDAAILSLPTFLHADYAEACAAKGIHILCEKPIEMSFEDAKRVAQSKKLHGVKLMVGQVVRFWPGYTDLRKMQQAGELGDILMAVFSRSSTVPARGGWIIDPEKGRGAIQDMHIHDIDFLSYLFGEADHVYSHAVRDYTGCFDHVISSVTFANGVRAVAEAAFSMRNSYPFSTFFRVCGTKATVEYRYRASVTNITDNKSCQMLVFRQDSPIETIEVEDCDPYARQLAYFLDCVEHDTETDVVPIEDSLRSIRLLDAVRASAASGKIESVAQPGVTA